MMTTVSSKIIHRYLANILSASKFRAQFWQPLAVEETISPQSRHALRLMALPPVLAPATVY
jgi:hypothetical protein